MTIAADITGAALTISAVDIYTVPAGEVAHIEAIIVANVHGIAEADATVQWTDASDSNAVTRLAHAVVVAAQDSRSMLAAPISLNAGDKIQALASADSHLEITVSYWTETV